MPKGSTSKAPKDPETIPTQAPQAPPKVSKRAPAGPPKSAGGGKIAGRIVPSIGAVPPGVRDFCVHRLDQSGRALEKIGVDVGGVRQDEFPIGALEQAGIAFLQALGPGRYQCTWLGLDDKGKRCSFGKSKRIEIAAATKNAPAARAVSPAEREAEIRREVREQTIAELRQDFEIRDQLRADGVKSLVEAMNARYAIVSQPGPAAPAAPSEDAINMKIELALLKARREWEEELEDEADDEEDEAEELARSQQALATVTANPDSLAAQIATLAEAAKQLMPIVALAAPLFARMAAPAPVAVVTPPPAAPAQAAKPKRAPKPKPKADTHQETAAPAAAE